MWRWAVLTAISVAMFGNYYAYDSIGPVADSLQRILGYTDTQIGTLNAIYSFPNIVMVLVGGVIVDRYGAARATLAFAAIQGIGALVTALSPLFPVMAAGRLIFGLGAESMIVAITVAIGQWFVGRQLGFAFGLNLSFARLGSYRRRHVDNVVQAPVRPRVAAAAVACNRLRGDVRRRRRCLLPARSQRDERDSPSPRRRRPTGSSGAICGASTAPTGTSWASASRSIR